MLIDFIRDGVDKKWLGPRLGASSAEEVTGFGVMSIFGWRLSFDRLQPSNI